MIGNHLIVLAKFKSGLMRIIKAILRQIHCEDPDYSFRQFLPTFLHFDLVKSGH